MLVHLVRPGQTFAEAALFGPGTYPGVGGGGGPQPGLAVAALAAARAAPRHRPELALGLVVSLSVWTRRLVGKLELLTQRRVEERLAIYLLGRAGAATACRPATTVELGEAKQLIAAQLGTAPEVLSRTFRQLEEDGILAVHGSTVSILDGARFAVLAEPIGV